MISDKVYELLNRQITKELFSAYIYLDISNYYSDEGLEGFENWFYIQAQEEMDHAMLIRRFLLNNSKKVKLLPVEAPNKVFNDFMEPLKISLQHEKSITASLTKIYSEANQENDFLTMEFLNWFIKEQSEEEKNSNDLIKKYELFGKDSQGLYQLDQELKTRAYTAPSLVLE